MSHQKKMPKITTDERVQIPQIAFHPARTEPLPPADDAAFFLFRNKNNSIGAGLKVLGGTINVV
jgi:hypothetical protein